MNIQLNTPYRWMRTEGWKNHRGEDRWWEVFVVVLGWNGTGGWWIRREWRHNCETATSRYEVESLGWAETVQLKHELEIVAAITRPSPPAAEERE